MRSSDADVFLLLLSSAVAINKPLYVDNSIKIRQINESELAKTMSEPLRNAILEIANRM